MTTLYELNYYQNGFNLMVKKGYEGDEEAVNKLSQEGGSLWDGVYGFALGGRNELVKKVLVDHPELLPAAATGYARAKNSKEIANLNGNDDLKAYLAYGYALAGNETQVRAALNSRGGIKYLPLIIEGLAATNQAALLYELVDKTRYYPNALKAAAKSAQHDLVTGLLDKFSINLKELATAENPLKSNTQTTLAYVLQGYSEGRHFEEAAEILELGVNPMHCLNALAPKGQLDPTDASLLLSTIKKPETREKVLKLMESQFRLKSDKLDFELKLPPRTEGESYINILKCS